MKNPLIDKEHLFEYILFGFIAALLYCTLLFFHLRNGNYESAYLLYIGNMLFGLAILLYNLKLLYKPYDKRRTMSMVLASHLATIAGTIISIILSLIIMFIIYPDVFSSAPYHAGLGDAPPNTNQKGELPGWLIMILINALILNFGAGSFISIMVSYAGKKNQTKDKPAHLGKHASNEHATNDA